MTNFPKIHTCTSPLVCQCEKLSKVKCLTWLGLEIDETFSWKNHINKINKKLRKMIHVFVNLRYVLNIKNLKLIYFAFVQSILQYGIIAWGSTYISNLNRLKRTQNILIRIIMKKHRLYSTAALYDEFEVFNIDLLYIHKLLYFLSKTNAFSTVQRNTQNTRLRGTAVLLKPELTKIKRHYIYLLPNLINNMPLELTNLPFKTARKKLKFLVEEFAQTEIGQIVLKRLNLIV